VPCDLVFLILDLASSKGNRRWLDRAIFFANHYNKPIYGIKVEELGEHLDYVAVCKAVASLEGLAVQAIIQKHATKADFKYI